MKNFKKLLAGVVAIATIGTAMAIPTNAIILKPSDSDDTTTADYYKENAITEAVIELTAPEFGDGIGTYYFLGTGEPSIDLSVFSDDDITNIKNGLPVKIDDTVDVSAVEKVITIDDVKDNCILIDIGYYYTHMSYEYYDGINSWCIEESIIPKETTEDTTTITEQTTTSATGEIKHDYYKTGSLSEVDGKNITVIVGNEPVTINLDDIDYTNAITDDDIGVLISVTFDGNTDEIKSISVIPQMETTTIPHQTEVPTTTVSDDSTTTDDGTIDFEFPYSVDDESKTVVYDDIEYAQLSGSDAHYYALPDDFDIQEVINGNGVLQLNGKKFNLEEAYIYGPSLDDPVLDVYNLFDDEGNGYMYTKSYKETSANQLLEGTKWVLNVDAENTYTINYITKQDDTTIGDSTEKVELNETSTGIRGDVNYDGEVNAIDLLLLKKYLLQLITW